MVCKALNGHIARARIMAAALAQRDDINVDQVTGRPLKYFDMEIFGEYRTFTGLSIPEAGLINGRPLKMQM